MRLGQARRAIISAHEPSLRCFFGDAWSGGVDSFRETPHAEPKRACGGDLVTGQRCAYCRGRGLIRDGRVGIIQPNLDHADSEQLQFPSENFRRPCLVGGDRMGVLSALAVRGKRDKAHRKRGGGQDNSRGEGQQFHGNHSVCEGGIYPGV